MGFGFTVLFVKNPDNQTIIGTKTSKNLNIVMKYKLLLPSRACVLSHDRNFFLRIQQTPQMSNSHNRMFARCILVCCHHVNSAGTFTSTG